jgi:hypothetical protein
MISVRRRLLFNTGKYESVEIESVVSDLPDDTDPDSISEMLDDVMAPEIARVEKVTSKTEDDTMLYTWIDITTNKEGC